MYMNEKFWSLAEMHVGETALTIHVNLPHLITLTH